MITLEPSKLDELFEGYKQRIINLLPRYQAMYQLLGGTPTELILLVNTVGKPCTPSYLNKQNKILEYLWYDELIANLLSKDFYGFINTRIVGGTLSSLCSLILHVVDFNDSLLIMKVNEDGVYRLYCDQPMVYYVVSGELLTLNIDGLEFSGDSFEFIVYPEFLSVIVQSNNDFSISLYRVTLTGDLVKVNSNVTDFVELLINLYITVPMKINGLIVFPCGDVYKAYLLLNTGDTITIEYLYDDYRYKLFAGIVKSVRWCKL